MSPERWERIAQAFEAASDAPPGERGAVLRRLADPELAAEVRALLESADAAGGFLSSPASWSGSSPTPDCGGDEGVAPTRPQLQTGAVLLDRFEIVRLLGHGGMGEVYAAQDRALGAEVALKLIRPAIAADPRTLTRFKREILTARRITHPNVCRIHDLAVQTEPVALSFLTMELLPGDTLAAALRQRGRLAAEEARNWLEQMAAGLAAAHAAGVVHRDFKPGNVMVTPQRAVITDFGLARWSPTEVEESLSGSRLLGTLAYMAPEQLSGDPATGAADVYAFGLVAYQMLTGRAAFAGSGPFAGVLQRLRGAWTPPSEVAGDLDPVWDEVLGRCLEEDPERRPAITEVLAPLAARGGAASPAPRSAPTPARLPPTPPRPARRRLPVAAGLTLVAGLAAVSLSVLAYRYFQMSPAVVSGAEILVTPVVNATQDAELDSATLLLDQQLAQSGHFNLVSDTQIHDQLQRMGKPALWGAAALAQQPAVAREVAMRQGAPLVVFATLTRLAGRYRLEIEMERVGHSPDAPARRWTGTQNADSKPDLFDAMHGAATWVRTQAGEGAAELASTDAPPQDITTSSWTALSYYNRAETERAAGRTPQALALLQQAVAVDPHFALAYTRLGDILVTQLRLGEGYAAYRRALANAGRMSQREQLRLRGLYDSDMDNHAGDVAAFQAYAALYPNDFIGYFYQALSDMQLGRPEQAFAALRTAQRLAPRLEFMPSQIAMLQTWQGRTADAERGIRVVRSMGVAEIADEQEAAVAFLEGDYARTDRLYAGLRNSSQAYWRTASYRLQARSWAERGQYGLARQALAEALVQDRSTGTAADLADVNLDLAYLDLHSGDLEAARTLAMESLRLDNNLKRLVAAGEFLAQAGDLDAAQGCLVQARRQSELQPLDTIAVEQLQGALLVARGHARAALPKLEAAAAAQGQMYDTGYLATARAAAGDLAGGLAIFDAWARQPGRVWYMPEYYFPGRIADLTFQAAKLSDQLGHPDATARWQHYLALRSGADPDLPEVTFANRRLQQLRAPKKGTYGQ